MGARITYVNVWGNASAPASTQYTNPRKQPLQLNRVYLVGMSTFDAYGGDGYTMLVNNSNAVLVQGYASTRM